MAKSSIAIHGQDDVFAHESRGHALPLRSCLYLSHEQFAKLRVNRLSNFATGEYVVAPRGEEVERRQDGACDARGGDTTRTRARADTPDVTTADESLTNQTHTRMPLRLCGKRQRRS
eukprot:4015297-Pleurochrysis_carterae.AAC.3